MNTEREGVFPSIGWDDVDGDGRIDLAAMGFADTVHLGDGAALSALGTFIGRPPHSLQSTGAIGDLDGDHRADLVLANMVLAPPPLVTQLGVYTWSADTQTLVAHLVDAPPLVQIALADVDDDGKLDVIGTLDTGGLVWLRNTTAQGVIALDLALPIAAAGTATWFAVTGWRP